MFEQLAQKFGLGGIRDEDGIRSAALEKQTQHWVGPRNGVDGIVDARVVGLEAPCDPTNIRGII